MDEELAELVRRSLPAGADAATLNPHLSLRGGQRYFARTQLAPPGGDEEPDTPEQGLPMGSSAYEMLDELGRGGMGIVYRAWQVHLEREVAMKTIRPSATVPHEISGAFLSEGRVTGFLDHPNIVPVYDLGRTESGELFLAMKLVRGQSWKQAMRQGGLSLDRNLEILSSVCNAVAYAHDKHVLHRDLKPDNVMLGAFGEVLVMDWGLAVNVAPPAERGFTYIPHASEVRFLGGTPCYMAPEMARLEVGQLSPATDVYLLGGILHELLTGRPTHSGDSVMETVVHAANAVSPPALDASVPEELRQICHRALAPAPTDRFPDVQCFQRAIQAYLEHRESAEITRRADERLAAVASSGASRHEAYGELAAIASAYEQARLLWSDNEDAAVGEEKARLSLSRAALSGGDVGLARSQLEMLRQRGAGVRADELAQEIDRSEEARAREQRSNRRIRGALIVAGFLLFTSLATGLLLVQNQKEIANENARRAEASETEAVGALAEVERLADVKRLRDLQAQAEELWPLRQALVPDLHDWLRAARELVGRRDLHRHALAQLRLQAQPSSDALRRSQLASQMTELAELQGQLALRRQHLDAAASEQARADLGQQVDWLESAVRERAQAIAAAEVFVLPTTELQWRHDVLASLIADLDAFGAAAGGLVEDVEERLRFAREVRARTVVAQATEWETAVAGVLADPTYRGLELVPQEGLVPLGADPASGLQEFLHLQSHSGDTPARSPDGQIVMQEHTGIILVLIPGGTFLMGAQREDAEAPGYDERAHPSEGPVHEVTLDPFFIGRHEVTQGQWLNVTGNNPAMLSPEKPAEFGITLLHPVDNVSWRQCTLVLGQLGLALPTEAQWEYCARAGTTTPWWTGAERESLLGAANVADRSAAAIGLDNGNARAWPELDDGFGAHAPVTSLLPNPFGLHHVHGNTYEWCRDHITGYTVPPLPGDGLRSDPAGIPRAFRGGAFDNRAVMARVTTRIADPPDFSFRHTGCRAARALDR